ncbi:gamma-glutamyl-gamma-aminobutyrate hydrolase family protein [soil metagenome]
MRKRPLIGITTRSELETRRFYLGRDYSEAIVGLGGVPVMVPLIDDPEYIADLVAGLDGVLLPGSDCDPDPAYYGEDPHPKLKRVVPEKDRTDLFVLAEAENRNLPVFGICFGLQILNVSRGGSLIQDIASQVEAAVKHDQGIPLERASHAIKVEGNGIISKAATNVTDRRVNSHHHQAVARVGSDLIAVAWTNNGVIEAVEDSRPGRWVVGVQWHPELSWRTDKLSRSLFEHFISASGDEHLK